jgi:hypothetical protein
MTKTIEWHNENFDKCLIKNIKQIETYMKNIPNSRYTIQKALKLNLTYVGFQRQFNGTKLRDYGHDYSSSV